MTGISPRSLVLVPFLLLLGLALGAPTASADDMLGISGSTAYSASSYGSLRPTIYARNLNSLKRKPIAIADGYVSSEESASSAIGVALTSADARETSLTLFKRNHSWVTIDLVKGSECPEIEGPAPVEHSLVPLSLADNGTITFIKRSASTGCAFQLFRKKLHDLARPVWMPPDTGPLVDYATIEVKGDLVLLSKAFWQASRPPIVFNWRSARILYTVPESLAGFYRIHLATSGELGLTYIAGSDSSAVRVSLKTGKSRRFEFPHRAEPRFCGPLTFFGGRRLVKVYDADGETLYRHLTGKIAVSGFEAMCSSQYAYYSGTKTAGAKPVSHDYVLSLSKFRTRRINPLDLRSQPITRP